MPYRAPSKILERGLHPLAEQFHAMAHDVVRHVADLHRELLDTVAERLVDALDLLDHRFRAAAIDRAGFDLLFEAARTQGREPRLEPVARAFALVIARLLDDELLRAALRAHQDVVEIFEA